MNQLNHVPIGVTSIRIPTAIPTAKRIARIRSESRKGRLLRNKSAIPTPALTRSPESIAPTERIPERCNSVNTTDDAQLGIKPTAADRTFAITGRFKIRSASRSSPTTCKAEVITNVNSNTKSVTQRVCLSADSAKWSLHWHLSRSQSSSICGSCAGALR